ncbi:5-(carboxyamino)imidazole ribonucleotide synthase [Ferrimonas balearica]|uniref:5-(carboxyamino)imidazole ribonucleotide synthase n=1 Tax=Ferrimonas balearica TaxID=44012 RepID=UPI001C9A0D42|nr:5-(carboxyamino)imidazole ribonucleotide synthase [Ferrimonas balearica]MBY5991790.1 5-(carboxyamino)imidazole ribonucleotide synthase [Ferrimonas balearica]
MRIAILGCGQLARMMALAGWARGHRFSFLAEPGEDPAPVEGLGEVVVAEPNLSPELLYRALGRPEVITPEREQLSAELLNGLAQLAPVYPDGRALTLTQHRAREKTFINEQGFATAPWQAVDPHTDLDALGDLLGWPLFIKSCEDGYDGLNQWRLDGPGKAPKLNPDIEYIAEGGVAFERELSLVAVRGTDGSVACYPLTENRHQGGVLQSSLAPAPSLPEGLQAKAEQMAHTLMAELNYLGVLTLELFLVEEQLLVNELAPRVHNSGHWTQSGADTCQFENHLRAITGLPLGATRALAPSAMVNLLGVTPPAPELCPGAKVHWYNKGVRPGRKVGHINLNDANEHSVRASVDRLVDALYGNA